MELDHLVLIAPSLAEGVAHLRAALGLEIPYGGAHPEMGTHNHLLRLGERVFLEVIAVDPAAPAPAHPRWFGLDDAAAVRAEWDAGRRLRAWVARSTALDPLLAAHGGLLGQAMRVSRGDRQWRFAVRPDGALPADGAAPCVIDWGERGCPAAAMPDLGARLESFTIEHPDPARLRALHAALGLSAGPELRQGPAIRLRAIIGTPSGPREIG
ncbi:Glyoxalase-like domain-containing protein [Roseomonas rosea]|uniref:Glyoxalase-like domain-containing protein n=1 Tax=Muricoccus roseus TaxID=198092 RepID=A0A1M6AFL5_9PROT|nr:VOC family protein [Roseomonas rosea]SHI35202.1 Glyoxalase-like domain-containing protein [Roseomonas rosea]